MNTGYVLDASAVLALLHREPGADVVAAVLTTSAISSVNWSEVIQKAAAHGIPTDGLADDLRGLGVSMLAFEAEDADAAARLWLTGVQRLSLADRACLATAQRYHLAAVTADRTWKNLELPIEVQVIR